MGRIRTAATCMALASLLLITGCSTPPAQAPDPSGVVGEDVPPGGIPTEVMWPSDWLEGASGELEAMASGLVSLALEYHEGAWVWRVTSSDPGMDWTGEQVADPLRGRETILDAATLSQLEERDVMLSDHAVDALAASEIGPAEAARLSGETYPGPRLVSLELSATDEGPVWSARLFDTEAGSMIRSNTFPATGVGEEAPRAKP